MKRLLAAFFLLAYVLAFAQLPIEGECLWHDAKPLAAGIKIKSFKYTKPRKLSVHAVKVDLSNKDIYLVTNSRPAQWGEPMPHPKTMKIATLRRRVWDFVSDKRKAGHNVRVAVNASPWGPWNDPQVRHLFAANMGVLVSDGEQLAGVPAHKKSVPSLIVRNDGSVDMMEYKKGDKVTGLKLAVSGFSFILRNGKLALKPDKPLHPRTFYGLSQDKRFLYLVVVDGRQKGFSEGMTCYEGGQFMKYLGAYNAINMDGGGSTTLVTSSSKGKKKLINSPSDAKAYKKDKYLHTRHVATALGVCVGKIKKADKVRKSGK